MMQDDVTDATDRTTGSTVYLGTASFYAVDDGRFPYGTQTWRLRADDEASASRTLETLCKESVYDDPRVDHVRDFHVEEDPDCCDEDQAA